VSEPSEPLLVVAVAALLFDGDRLLCMRRSPERDAGPGLWETLSGRVRPGEDPLAAVRREIGEECGLEVELDARPVTAYSAKRNDDPMVVIVFRARVTGGEVVLSDEHDSFDWLTPGELALRSPLALLVQAARTALELPWPGSPGGVQVPSPQRGGGR
jgi:8-oxo-dGTP pyrophosphatase MutT (NUDIX family)